MIKGIVTYIPGGYSIYAHAKQGKFGGSSRLVVYCYAVWLKHLTRLWKNGMRNIPSTVVELGPGSSLGVGFSALLSGATNYYALDVIKYADTEQNLRIFDALVDLFKSLRIPTHSGHPFRFIPDSDSNPFRTPIPIHFGHPFQSNPDSSFCLFGSL